MKNDSGSHSKSFKGQNENFEYLRDINMMESNKELPKYNISEPVVRMQTGTSAIENESSKSKNHPTEEIKYSIFKRNSISVPLEFGESDTKQTTYWKHTKIL